MNHNNCDRFDPRSSSIVWRIARVGDISFAWVYHTARLTLTIRSRGAKCEEESQGIHTALSHSANVENVCEWDRRRQRTMAIRGRRLKSVLQRILRLISIVDRPFSVCNQTNGWNLNEEHCGKHATATAAWILITDNSKLVYLSQFMSMIFIWIIY